MRVARDAWAFVASPLRAIADMVYVDRRVTWKGDGIGYLTESLRMETTDLCSLPFDAFDEIVDGNRSRRVREYLSGLRGEVDHAG